MSQSYRGFEDALADAVRGEVKTEGLAARRVAWPHAVVSGKGTSVMVTGGTVLIGEFPDHVGNTKQDERSTSVGPLVAALIGLVIGAGTIYAIGYFG